MSKEMMETKNIYRADIPPVPERLLNRPVLRGYPVPWFVAEVDGHYDFRIIDSRKFAPAINLKLCWVCGTQLGSTLAFTIGPMCAINRTISEPPSHRECAEFSIKACPFLNQSETKRREGNMPCETQDAAGVGLKRQPGVVCLWLKKSYKVMKVENGILFQIGEPLETFWYRQGRAATREEITESIDSGLPLLFESAPPNTSPGELWKAKKVLEEKRNYVLNVLVKD